MKRIIKIISVYFLIIGFGLVKCSAIENDIEEEERSINGQVIELIEQIKLQMPCGFPALGIPSLAPFTTSHQNISLAQGKIIATGEINDFRLDGLNNFDIQQFTINILTFKMKFDFLWKKINLTTDYLIDTTLNKLALSRSGHAAIAINDFNVWGNMNYKLNPLNGKFRIKELKLYVKLGAVKFDIEGLSTNALLNRKLNELMEEWVTLIVNDNTENVALFSNNVAMPILNALIADMDVVDILLNLINSEPGEPCIPTETLIT